MPDDTASVYSNDHDHNIATAVGSQHSDRKQPWMKDEQEVVWASLAPAINRFRDYCEKSVNVNHLLRILGDRTTTTTVATGMGIPDDSELVLSFCAENVNTNNPSCCRISMTELGDKDPIDRTKLSRVNNGTCIHFDPRRVHGANFLVWLAMYRAIVLHDVCDFVVHEADLVTGITVVDLVVALCILRCQVGVSARVTLVQTARTTPRKWSLRYSLRAVVRRLAQRRCANHASLQTAKTGEITLKEFIDRMYWMAWACRGITGQKAQFNLINATVQKGYTDFVRPYNKHVKPHEGATDEEILVYQADTMRLQSVLANAMEI